MEDSSNDGPVIKCVLEGVIETSAALKPTGSQGSFAMPVASRRTVDVPAVASDRPGVQLGAPLG
jgi:hypothetical protein